MQRRTVLVTLGSAAIGLQAGCLASSRTPNADESGIDGGAPTETDSEPSVISHSIAATETGCMTDEADDHVEMAFCTDGITLDGVTAGPNPCHGAAITSEPVETGTLSVQIELESTDELCVECIGRIDYLATIDLAGVDGINTVTVEHAYSGETHTVTRGAGTPEETQKSSLSIADNCHDYLSSCLAMNAI